MIQALLGLGWGWLGRDLLRAIGAGLTMLYQPDWMGILPVFIWYMLVLSGFRRALVAKTPLICRNESRAFSGCCTPWLWFRC